jgi:RND family efflux transporter MFP subunit
VVSAEASGAKKPEPLAVKVAMAEERRTDRSILVTGSLLPDEIVTVVSEVPGKIVSVKVDFGQNVRRGDILAEMDKTEYQLQVDRSKAALAQGLARLGLTAADGDKTPENTPAMRQAWAQVEDAKFKFENAKKLVKSGDISEERFTELEKLHGARMASYEAAKDEMRTQWASLDALRADIKLMEKKVRDTTIRAPFDGSISERKVAPGQYVKDNVALATIVKTFPIRLRLEVPESAAGFVRVGTALEFTTDAAMGRKFQATVRELNPALNEQSRTLMAEARLNTADAQLRPGMFVQVRLILERGVQAVVVPKAAVHSVAGLTKVFVVQNGKVAERRVPPGEMLQEWMEVPADVIKPGEQVVITNLPLLSNGVEVTVTGEQRS